MPDAKVVAIYLHGLRGAPLSSVKEVKAVPGCGLETERYFHAEPGKINPDQEITLIEQEAIDAVAVEHGIVLSPNDPRRNVVTRGVRLNDLVDKEFDVGGVRLRGRRLCQPCDHLESLTHPGVKVALKDRGGLRAQILRGGVIRMGDAIVSS